MHVIKTRPPQTGADHDPAYGLVNMDKFQALSLCDALQHQRRQLAAEMNQAMSEATDEGRLLEELAFLGETLGRVCRMEYELREKVEL